MLKLDYIMCPQNNKIVNIKNLLLIDYENNNLTTSNWIQNNIESDLKIEHINTKDSCYSDKLLEIIELYELNEDIKLTDSVIFFTKRNCEDNLPIENNNPLLKGI